MKRGTLLAGTALMAGLTASVLMAYPSAVQAETANGFRPIVQKLAARFGVSESEVQQVFDENRAEQQAEMQKKFEARLDEAVAAGKLTQEQKSLILQKHAELQQQRQAEMESFKDLTPEQRREQMQVKRSEMEARRAELEAWAKEHGIDLSYLMMGGPRDFHENGMGGHHGFGKGSEVTQ